MKRPRRRCRRGLLPERVPAQAGCFASRLRATRLAAAAPNRRIIGGAGTGVPPVELEDEPPLDEADEADEAEEADEADEADEVAEEPKLLELLDPLEPLLEALLADDAEEALLAEEAEDALLAELPELPELVLLCGGRCGGRW